MKEKENNSSYSRKEFLKKIGVGTAGLAMGTMGMNARSYGNIVGANDRSRSGAIGAIDSLSEGEGELLYNGIRLPSQWPPQSQNPASRAPMEVPYLKHPPGVIPIDVGRQLFVDDFLIDATNLKRVYHRAKKYEGNPVFGPSTKYELDKNQDQSAVTYLGHGGVFFDPKMDLFKMFYTAGWRGELAMATSKDLIHWRRPNLGVLGESNLLLPEGELWAGGDNSIWLDLNATNANERLKYLTHRRIDLPSGGSHTLQTSARGKIWSQGVFTTVEAGDYSSFFYNPFRDVWVFSIKTITDRGRARSYDESEDFIIKGADWRNAVFWIGADKRDQPDPDIGDVPQLYSLNGMAYESIILGEFYILLGPKNEVARARKTPKMTEIELGYSRDGFHWSRPDRRAFINPTGNEGDWDRGYIHGTTGVVLVMGDKLWFPYCGYSGIAPDGTRGMYTGASIGMATLRRDGFASMQAGAKKGFLTTRPVVFKGSYLFVNVDCPEGELRVEVLDQDHNIIKPFSAKNCKSIQVDKTLHAVQWKNGPNLSALAGKPVKFKFYLTTGKLYSFWVSPSKSGASHGYVGAGGPGFEGRIDTKGIKAY